MEKDPIENRLKRIEGKLTLLLGASLVQTFLLAIIAVGYFLPSTFTLGFLCVLLILFVFYFHRQIPAWFGWISRYIYAQILSAQNPDSIKDWKEVRK